MSRDSTGYLPKDADCLYLEDMKETEIDKDGKLLNAVKGKISSQFQPSLTNKKNLTVFFCQVFLLINL